MDNVLTMLYVDGKEDKLFPLCKDRSISAVPFGGRYLIIDFVLSNFLNSGFFKIKVLTQYKYESLIKHIFLNWNLSPILGHHIEIVPPQMKTDSGWYSGSADAIYQNLNFLEKQRYDYVYIFRSDIICKMDIQQIHKYHIAKGGDVTIAASPVPIKYAKNFEIIEVDKDYRVIGYEYNPENPKPIPRMPNMAFASMGNYIFNSNTLVDSVSLNNKAEAEIDLNTDLFPEMINKYKIFAYDFDTNNFPGMTREEKGYWININNLDSYWKANMGLVAVSPIFNLYGIEWPIRSYSSSLPPAKFVFANKNQGRIGIATDSVVSEGCIISGGTVNRSLLFPKVRINSFSQITDSILMEGAEIGRGVKIKNAIIENFVTIPQDMVIGYDLKEDNKYFYISPSGIVVVTRESIAKFELYKEIELDDQYSTKNTLNNICN